MEVKQSGIGPPFCDGSVHGVVIQRTLNIQPSSQVVSGPNIVARKDVGSAKPTEQNILRRPSADASKFQ